MVNFKGLQTMTSRSTIKNTWYALREFETREITSRYYLSRHSRKLSAAKMHEISSHFIQAREYFKSAEEASFTVRPVLQYYGVATLAQGLTLFLARDIRQSTLKPSHGLECIDWRNKVSGGLDQVESLVVRTTDGVFTNLLESTDSQFYYRHNSSAVNWTGRAQVPPTHSRIALGEVLARIPNLSNQYSAWKDLDHTGVIMLSFKLLPQLNQFRFEIPENSREKLDMIFPLDKCHNRSIFENGDKLVVQYDQGYVPFLAQRQGWMNIGNVWLYPPIESKIFLTPLAVTFVVSFVFGMLCRYFPATWISLFRAEKGDSIYPLVAVAMDHIQDVFPAMVVDYLRGPYDFESESANER